MKAPNCLGSGCSGGWAPFDWSHQHVELDKSRLLEEIQTPFDGRLRVVMDAIRAEATNSILVDNGDFLQGNPMGDYIAY